MKLLSKALRVLAAGACLPAALLLAGCGSTQYADPVNPPQPFTFPGQGPATAGQPQGTGVAPSPALPQAPVPYSNVNVNPNAMTPQTPSSGILRAGDLVRVTFSDIPQPMQPVEIRLPADGRITLPYNVTVIAVNKSVSQLQEEIRNAYVPKWFVRLTVNIITEERFYFVGGEVKSPQRQPYFGENMTVLRAIDSVGGFTDFANRRKIELRRAADGKVYKIDWNKAVRNPSLDLPVYPNDHITVPRRVFF